MSYNISILIVYFFEFFISLFFFSQVSNFKVCKSKICLFGIFSFGVSAIMNIVFSTIWLNFITFFIANCVFSKCCFSINIKQSVFYSIVLDIVSTATEYITIFIVSVISKEDVAYNTDQYYIFIINALICKALYFLLILILSRFVKLNNVSMKIPLTFYFYPISVVGVLLFLWRVYISFSLTDEHKLFVVIISSLLLLSTIVLFLSYKNNLEKENRILVLENEVNKTELDKLYYSILEHQNQNLKIYAHDTKKHLTAIRNLTENEEIINYLEQMTEDLNKYNNVVSSGNHNLDVILNKYITECEIKEIDFEYDVRLSNLKTIEIYDLVTILGNALDNALESAVNTIEKKIELKTDYKNNFDVIVIKNSCEKKPKTEDNNLKTTKQNKSMHGLGLKSMKNALDKYNGDFSWEYIEKEKIFILTVMVMRK